MPPRTPLLRPGRFFAERELHATRLAVVLTLLVLSLPAAMWGVGWVLTDRVDGTVTVENPDRPPEPFCQDAPESMAEGCDEPAQIERDVDAVLWEAIGELVLPALIGFLVVLFIVGGLLHVGSWMLGGENGAAESFAVALWGLFPQVFGVIVLLVMFAVVVDPVSVTPDTGGALVEERVRADLRPVLNWQPVVVGVGALWGGAIWRYGLEHERGLTRGESIGLAGSVTFLYWLLSLV